MLDKSRIDQDNIYHVKQGELMYMDTFAGMLKGKYIRPDNNGGLYFQVTSKNNRVYKYGEILTCDKLWTFPRVLYHKTGMFTFYLSHNYTFDKG